MNAQQKPQRAVAAHGQAPIHYWQASQVYCQGHYVEFNGHLWRARQWNINLPPSSQSEQWLDIGPSAQGTPTR